MHGSKINQEAIASYSQSFSDRIATTFFNANVGINGQQIISVTDNKQVNFFLLKNLFEEWQAETKKLKSPYFDYNSNEVSLALKTLVNTLSKHIYIQKDDFVPLLTAATEKTLQLIYDPASYFSEELARMSSNDKVREFKLIGRYMKMYIGLYEDILNRLVTQERNNLDQLVRDAVDKFDDNDDEQSRVVALFDAILPLDILEEEIAEAMTTKEAIEDDLEDLFAPLAEVEEPLTNQSEPVDSTPSIPPAAVEPKPDPISTQPTASEEDFEPFIKDEVENINAQYTQKVTTLNDTFEEPEKPAIVADTPVDSLSSINSNININQRYMFVHDLFDDNDHDYELALEDVEHCASFDSAVEVLVQKYSKKYTWDMGSDEVKEMLKVIFKHFRK